ncbi:hypothetical protein GOL41_30700 [Sinorhizobium medicae]|nr:hypothetical protein [Sinorhizobium medicae]
MCLHPHEFIWRFLLHLLPAGFHRMRHFGFLANSHRRGRMALCRMLLGQASPPGRQSHSSDTTAEVLRMPRLPAPHGQDKVSTFRRWLRLNPYLSSATRYDAQHAVLPKMPRKARAFTQRSIPCVPSVPNGWPPLSMQQTFLSSEVKI